MSPTCDNPAAETELNKVPHVPLSCGWMRTGRRRSPRRRDLALGPVDVLFNNAGYGLAGVLEAAADDQLVHEINTNLLGVTWVTQAFLPAMRERGSGVILTTTSIGGFITFIDQFIAATKFGLEGWSESLAFEPGFFGVRVKTVAPSAASPPLRRLLDRPRRTRPATRP